MCAPMWMVGTKGLASGRAAGALNHLSRFFNSYLHFLTKGHSSPRGVSGEPVLTGLETLKIPREAWEDSSVYKGVCCIVKRSCVQTPRSQVGFYLCVITLGPSVMNKQVL